MPYQVGVLEQPKADDPVFDELRKAIRHAINLCSDSPIGIWTSQEEGSETIAIVYQQNLFRI